MRSMYAAITTALGGTPRFHAASLIPQTQDLLAAETEERGKKVTVVIDEAHLLDAGGPRVSARSRLNGGAGTAAHGGGHLALGGGAKRCR
jgi:hypothetical protein